MAAAFILCEIAGDLDAETQRDYVHGATVDAEVESEVIGLFEELESEPNYRRRRIDESVMLSGATSSTSELARVGWAKCTRPRTRELKTVRSRLKFLPGGVGAADHVATRSDL